MYIYKKFHKDIKSYTVELFSAVNRLTQNRPTQVAFFSFFN